MGFELAAIAGVEVWRYSLRQLQWMADAKLEADWGIASHILAKLHNIPVNVGNMFGGRGRERTPVDFDPYYKRRQRNQDVDFAPISILKQVFVDGQNESDNSGRSMDQVRR